MISNDHHDDMDDEGPEILASEKARLRALSLALIRSVVEQHHGSVGDDMTSEYIDIDVPDEEAVACAEEIGKQMGLICHHVFTEVDALFKGKMLARFNSN